MRSDGEIVQMTVDEATELEDEIRRLQRKIEGGGDPATFVEEVQRSTRAKRARAAAELANAEQLLKGQDLLPIPPGELARVKGMNRAQRRRWFRDRKRKLKLAAIRQVRAAR